MAIRLPDFIYDLPDLDGSDGLMAIIIPALFQKQELGVHFITPPELAQQVGILNHPKGTKIPLHTHRKQERTIKGTQEVLFVRSGSVLVKLQNTAATYAPVQLLGPGDIIILIAGYHALEMMEDTELVEIKQGPYSGKEQDKILYVPK